MDVELRKSICDFFDANDFAEYIGVTTDDLIENFPDHVEDSLDDLKELMGLRKDDVIEDNEEEEE